MSFSNTQEGDKQQPQQVSETVVHNNNIGTVFLIKSPNSTQQIVPRFIRMEDKDAKDAEKDLWTDIPFNEYSETDLYNYLVESGDLPELFSLSRRNSSVNEMQGLVPEGATTDPQASQSSTNINPQNLKGQEVRSMLRQWITQTGGQIPTKKRKVDSTDSGPPKDTTPPASSPTFAIPVSALANLRSQSSGELPKVFGSPVSSPPRVVLDDSILQAKSNLFQVFLTEKEIGSFCKKMLDALCTYLEAPLGGLFLNEHQNLKDWTLCGAFPSTQEFQSGFHMETGYHFILQAALTKKAICSTIADKDMSLLIQPLIQENALSGKGLGVLVLGVKKDSAVTAMESLKELSSIVAASLRSIQMEVENTLLKERLEKIMLENQKLKQIEHFDVLQEKLEIATAENHKLKQICTLNQTILSTLTAVSDACIICTDLKGTITYFSRGAQQLLGYAPTEVIGQVSTLDLHVAEEIAERATQLENEVGKKLKGLSVLIEYAEQGMADTRTWTLIKKDGSKATIQITVRALLDGNASCIGFIEIGRELSGGDTANAPPTQS